MQNNGDTLSRTRTPIDVTAPDPTAAQMHRLSLDHGDEKVATASVQVQVPDTPTIATSPSKKRPASSEVSGLGPEDGDIPFTAGELPVARTGKRPVSDPQAARRIDALQSPLPRPKPRIKQLFDPNAETGAPPVQQVPRSSEDGHLLHLRDIDGLSWKDIAARFSGESGKVMTANAVRIRYTRVKNKHQELTEDSVANHGPERTGSGSPTTAPGADDEHASMQVPVVDFSAAVSPLSEQKGKDESQALPQTAALPRGILEVPAQARERSNQTERIEMIKQPNSRPITNEQLSAEVKGIYAGLVIVETKCINIDRTQTSEEGRRSKPSIADWQALTALHRTLLYEHHDFLLASQHPSASKQLKGLANEHHMPVRMWKHAIHAYLEVLRQHLPESIDFMLNFIYLSYQMMCLLLETVEMFKDTWTECLGDLGRYRMAIENEDFRDREIWSGVARSWYSKASDRNPAVGRLYHHLGILARPNALQQLYYYSKSLTAVYPFWNARESIMTLFDPLLGRSQMAAVPPAQAVDVSIVRVHAYMFAERPSSEVRFAQGECCTQLDSHINRAKARWKDQGAFIAIANIAAFYGYGSQQNVFRQIFTKREEVCNALKLLREI